MVVQFSGNIGQTVLSAVAVQYFTGDLKRFDRLRDIILFIVIAGIIVPALVSLLVASTFVAIEWVDNFPRVWRTRFLSNFLATLTITPLTILAWDKAGSALPAVSVRRCTEASALMLGIVATGFLISVSSRAEPYQFMALLYLPLPFLLWAVVRFGLGGVCLSILLFGEMLVLTTLHTRRAIRRAIITGKCPSHKSLFERYGCPTSDAGRAAQGKEPKRTINSCKRKH